MMTSIDGKTKIIFVIGNPIEHTISPRFQNAALQACGINAVYVPLKVYENDFDETINGIKRMDLLGLTATLPYKRKIISALDEMDADARHIGAVNAVKIIKRGIWKGSNTDWYGVFKTLEINKISKKAKTLIIGAGGAASATVHGIQKYGIASITIANRTRSKAEELASRFNLHELPYSDLSQALKEFSLIVNATSMHFDTFVDQYNESTTYFDLKYYMDPPNTKNYIDGKDMLLHTGAGCFELWTGVEAPLEIMREKLFGNKE